MAIFTWSEQYATGIDTIDAQHKGIFDIINKLFDTSTSRLDRKTLRPILQGLVDYTKKHLAYEENMLAQAGYPDLQQHKKYHASLVEKLRGFVDAYNAGDTRTLIKLPTFLKDWLCSHILEIDNKYIACVQKAGVS